MAVRSKFRIDASEVQKDLRKVEEEVKASSKRQTDALKKEGKKAGEEQAKEIVKGLRAQFNARQGQIKEMFARGLIDRNELRRQSNEAKKAFNDGILKAMDDLEKKGDLSQGAMTRLGRSLKSVGSTGRQAGQQISSSWSKAKVAVGAVIALVAGSKVVRWFGGMVGEARELGRSFLKLSASAKLFGVEQGHLNRLAQEGVSTYKLTIRESNELATTVAKLTARAEQSGKAFDVQARLLDLAAAQGMNAAEANEALDQALRGVDEGTDKLFQRNPSDLYKEYAAQVGKSASALTEVEKKQAIVNAVLQEGAKVQGEYGRQLDTDLGTLDRWDRLLKGSGERIGTSLIPILAQFADLLAGPVAFATDLVVGLFERMSFFGSALALSLADVRIGLLEIRESAKGIPGLGRMLGAPDPAALGRARDARRFLEEAALQEFNRSTSGRFAGSSYTTGGPAGSPSTPTGAPSLRIGSPSARSVSAEGIRAPAMRLFKNLSERAPGAVSALGAVRSAIDGVTAAQVALTQAQLEGDTEGQVAASEQLAAAKEELRGRVAEVAAAMKVLVKDDASLVEVQEALTKALGEAGVELEATGKSWEEIGSTIEGVARGVLSVADALGILDDQTRRVLQGVVDVAGGFTRFSSGDVIGGVSQMVGGALGFFGGLFGGGGESESARAVREALEANRRALERNTQALEGTLAATDPTVGRVRSALEATFDAQSKYQGDPRDPYDVFNWRYFLEEQLSAMGLSMEDVARLAEEFGVSLTHSDFGFKTLLELLQRVSTGDVASSFAGAMELLRREFELMGAADPAERIRRIREELSKFVSEDLATQIAGVDFTDPEAVQAFMETVLAAVREGTFDLESLGSISLNDFLDVLRDLKSIGEEGATEAGFSRSVQIARSITEVQAVEVVAWLQDIAYTGRDQLAALQGIYSMLSVAAVAGGGRTSIPASALTPGGGLVVNGDVSVSAGLAEDEYWRLWRRLGEEVLLRSRGRSL